MNQRGQLVLLLSFIFSFPPFAFGVEPAAIPHTAIIYNTLQGDDVYGNPDDAEALVFRRVERQFPKAYPTFVRGGEEQELKDVLKRNVSSLTVVDSLVLMSHGEFDLRRKMPVTFSIAGFELFPEDARAVEGFFGPLFGKFAPNAKIVLTGCLLLSGDVDAQGKPDEGAILKRMIRVAKAFHLETGSLYMNRTEGTPFYDAVALQTAHQQETFGAKLRNLFFHLTAPISYPIGWVNSEYIRNQGYTLKISKTDYNGTLYRLFRDRMMNAQSSDEPKGAMVAVDRHQGITTHEGIGQ